MKISSINPLRKNFVNFKSDDRPVWPLTDKEVEKLFDALSDNSNDGASISDTKKSAHELNEFDLIPLKADGKQIESIFSKKYKTRDEYTKHAVRILSEYPDLIFYANKMINSRYYHEDKNIKNRAEDAAAVLSYVNDKNKESLKLMINKNTNLENPLLPHNIIDILQVVNPANASFLSYLMDNTSNHDFNGAIIKNILENTNETSAPFVKDLIEMKDEDGNDKFDILTEIPELLSGINPATKKILPYLLRGYNLTFNNMIHLMKLAHSKNLHVYKELFEGDSKDNAVSYLSSAKIMSDPFLYRMSGEDIKKLKIDVHEAENVLKDNQEQIIKQNVDFFRVNHIVDFFVNDLMNAEYRESLYENLPFVIKVFGKDETINMIQNKHKEFFEVSSVLSQLPAMEKFVLQNYIQKHSPLSAGDIVKHLRHISTCSYEDELKTYL